MKYRKLVLFYLLIYLITFNRALPVYQLTAKYNQLNKESDIYLHADCNNNNNNKHFLEILFRDIRNETNDSSL